MDVNNVHFKLNKLLHKYILQNVILSGLMLGVLGHTAAILKLIKMFKVKLCTARTIFELCTARTIFELCATINCEV